MNELEKEFAPYQESLELKELGFDEPCFAYHKENKLYQEAGVCYVNADFEATIIWDEMVPNKNCTAPLYQQAFRWFREKYFIHHEIGRDYDTWGYELYDFKSGNKHIPTGLKAFETYEEAELACLRKLIEIVKTKGGEQ